MPPRYAYWTILVDDQPTAFRAGSQEDLMPTFKRLKEKNPSATMKWFQNGRLWESRVDAQEAMRVRGERGREGDRRQGLPTEARGAKVGGFRDRFSRPPAFPKATAGRHDRESSKARRENLDWKPRGESDAPARGPRLPAPRSRDESLEWKPKGEFTPAPRRSERPDWKPKSSFDRGDKPEWKPKGKFDRDSKPDWKPKGKFDRAGKTDWKPKARFDRDSKPEWKPKGKFDRDSKPEWKPKGKFDRDSKPEWKPKGKFDRDSKPDWKPKGKFDRDSKPDWKPKGKFDRDRKPGFKPRSDRPRAARDEKPLDWKPKSEGRSSDSRLPAPDSRQKRDKNWRPGGEHRDPRQKYKDAKKAKWQRFKKQVRTRWESKQTRKKKTEN